MEVRGQAHTQTGIPGRGRAFLSRTLQRVVMVLAEMKPGEQSVKSLLAVRSVPEICKATLLCAYPTAGVCGSF